MQCVTPLFRLYDISSKETVRIVPRSEVMEGLELNPNNIKFQLSKMNSHYLARNQLIQTIPCQHCWACKLNYSAEWATRNMLETMEHEENYFITLTYDDEHLPIPEYMTYKEQWDLGYKILEIENKVENDGTWIDGSLYPDHVKKFLKDLRNYAQNHLGIHGIRYFYCGEYGETTQRPHYHMLLYGMHLDPSENYSYHVDKKFFKPHWKNKLLDELWPYGMHDIANIEWNSAAYVARYCMKKVYEEENSDKWYAENGKMKEFIRMSTHPGIGMKYYERNKLKIYENDGFAAKTVKGNNAVIRIKAFDKVFKQEYPEEFEKIEKHRKECAERARRNNYRLSNYTDLERLQMKAEKIANKAKMLPRDMSVS